MTKKAAGQIPSPSEPSQNNSSNDGHNNTIFEQTFTSEPPPYSSSVPNAATTPTSTDNNRPERPSTLLPNTIDFSKYTIPNATLSKDASTISTYHPSFSSSPSNLVRFIQEQAALPPLPYVHIQGEKQEGASQRDFDIKINMLPLFLDQSQNNNSNNNNTNNSGNKWNYVRLVADSEPAYRGKHDPSTSPVVKGGLDEWAKRFCKETSMKSFTLTRQLSNWNASYIEGQIRALIASTGYDKPITVRFPVKYAKVVVYPPKNNTINGFFTTLVSPLLDKKRYEVVRAVWPYASLPPVADPAVALERVPVVQSEELWWEEWRDVIRWAVLSRRVGGWVSIDDVLEYRMAPVVPQGNTWRW